MAGMFFTHPSVARKMVEWAGDLTGFDVLEPSSGGGAIVRAMPKSVKSVTAVEKSKKFADALAVAGAKNKKLNKVVNMDFVELARNRVDTDFVEYERFDIAIGNPPYEEGADVEHTYWMTKVADRVIVLLRANVEHNVSFHKKVLGEAHLYRRAKFVGRPGFIGPDDKEYGARHDYSVYDLIRRGSNSESLLDLNPACYPLTEYWRVTKKGGIKVEGE